MVMIFIFDCVTLQTSHRLENLQFDWLTFVDLQKAVSIAWLWHTGTQQFRTLNKQISLTLH